MYHTKLIALAFIIVQISGFSLHDEQTSYAEFEKWPTANLSRLSFRFKTYAKNGLILYVDDGGFAQYLTLYLSAGSVVVDLYDGRRTYKHVSKALLNDLSWHEIYVELNSRHVEVSIDGQTLADYKTKRLTFRSMVFFGGFPRSVSIADVASFEVGFLPRLLGCIEDVRYGNSSTNRSALMVDSGGRSNECKDACKPENPCMNNGVCINKFALAKCLCTGTGHMGERCQKELPVIGIPTTHRRVIIDMPSAVVANLERTSLLVRFRTTQPDGVFFYTAAKGDYILLELTNGNVATAVNLGSGSVTIVTKNAAYNDNNWHTARLERFERMVNLTVDGGTTFTGYTKGNFTGFSSESSGQKMTITLGGAIGAHLKRKSLSRQNFTGCLQELVFNQYDVFSKLNMGTDRVRSRGTIVTTCPEVPTQPVTPPIPSTPSTTSNPPPLTTNGSLATDLSSKSDYTSSSSVPTLEPVTTRIMSENTRTILVNASDSSENARTAITTYTDDQIRSEYITELTIDIEDFSVPDEVRITLPGKPTDHVIMAETDNRGSKEGDLTLWFILAAGVGVIAFIIVLVVIIKVHTASRKKYEIKESKTALAQYGSGSFHRSPCNSKSSV